MLQKELAKRLKARYDTKMNGNEWLEATRTRKRRGWRGYYSKC